LYSTVVASENARVNYRYRLEVLQGFYHRTGNSDKFLWASNELNNLDSAQWFRYEGLEKVQPAPGETVTAADERMLVEAVVETRRTWQAAMLKVAQAYDAKGMALAADAVRRALERFDPVRTYMYFLSAEIPPADLKPTAVVPEADQVYREAYGLFRAGKISFGITDYSKERRALLLFMKLIHDYPTSNKIALSAYYIADIYKEYWDEDVRAVNWYERAWQWDPNVTEPARFQAATVYDHRLRDNPRAIECYRAALKYDPERVGNFDEARKRIKKLSGSETQETPRPPQPPQAPPQKD
jgi:tetratricopeptide (TPR) repeat protein